MTSAQRMLKVGLLIASAILGSGCASTEPRLVPPTRLTAPYDTAQGDILWAVAPPRNESGTTVPSTEAVADALASATNEVAGLTALPVNRSIRAMRALGLREITSPTEAQQLASVLGVDAVIVSTITAFDPYDPPTLGLTVALYAAPGRLDTRGPALDDIRLFSLQATDNLSTDTLGGQDRSRSTVARHFDARDHETLMALRRYAEGRTEPNDPFGWRAYLKSMPLYTAFAAHQAVGSLLDREWLRLARARNAPDQ